MNTNIVVQEMTITTITSRDFYQDTGRAKKAIMHGLVFVPDHGKPTMVLLSMKE